MTTTVQSIIDRLKHPDVSQDEVLEYPKHNAALVRVNAIEAAARLARNNKRLIEVLANEAQRRHNAVPLLGTATVGHVVVACLLRVGTPEARRAAVELLDAWPGDDRKDLIWYLQSEGLLNDEY